MKQMTCSQIGSGMEGMCETMIQGETAKEMADNGWKHLEEAHPEAAQKMAAMPQEEKDKWFAEFQPRFDALPNM